MSLPVPSCEPTALTAGDSATWTFADVNYSSATFTLSYALIGTQDKLVWNPAWVTTKPDGSFLVFLPMTALANLCGGAYRFTRFLTDGTTGLTTELAPLTLAPNPALQDIGTSPAARLERDIAALTQAINARLCGDQPEEYAIGGMSVKKIPVDSLQRMRTSAQNALWRLTHPGQRRQQVVRFTVPSA
jgi:hypothetical protein